MPINIYFLQLDVMNMLKKTFGLEKHLLFTNFATFQHSKFRLN